MLALLALLLAAPPARPDATAETAITVTATKYTAAQAQERASAFVRAVLPTPDYGQYGRWTVPVCLKLTGITEPGATLVATRVRAVAEAAGIAIARPGCRATSCRASSPPMSASRTGDRSAWRSAPSVACWSRTTSAT